MHKTFEIRKGKKRDQEEKRKEDHHEFYFFKRDPRVHCFYFEFFYFCFIVLSFPLKEYKNRILKIQLVEIIKNKIKNMTNNNNRHKTTLECRKIVTKSIKRMKIIKYSISIL